MSESEDQEIPKTDICEKCDHEIVAELTKVKGKHELIHQARKKDEGFMLVTAGKASVCFSCSCSHVEVEFGPGSTSAWDIPDEWMWESNYPELFNDGDEEQ